MNSFQSIYMTSDWNDFIPRELERFHTNGLKSFQENYEQFTGMISFQNQRNEFKPWFDFNPFLAFYTD